MKVFVSHKEIGEAVFKFVADKQGWSSEAENGYVKMAIANNQVTALVWRHEDDEDKA